MYHLAYGLSHELNNPLANIATRAGVLLQRSGAQEDRRLLETIIDSAMRGSEMLGDLMLTARPSALNLQSVDLAELGAVILRRGSQWTQLWDQELAVHWSADGRVRIDTAYVSEAVWAILRNAIEASPQPQTIHLSGQLDGRTLRIQIDDTGAGLSSEALRHCFDAYFSGREAGRGLGLGLTKAKRLARLHGGDVTLTNRPVGGCSARLWFEVEPESA